MTRQEEMVETFMKTPPVVEPTPPLEEVRALDVGEEEVACANCGTRNRVQRSRCWHCQHLVSGA